MEEDVKLEGVINGLGELDVSVVDKVDKVAKVLGLVVDNYDEKE